MKTSRILTFVLLIIMGLSIGYLVGRSNKSSVSDKDQAENITPPPEPDSNTGTDLETNEGQEAGEGQNSGPGQEADESQASDSGQSTDNGQANNNQNTDSGQNNGQGQGTNLTTLPGDKYCFANEKETSLQLTLFAERKEKEQLMYNNTEPAKLQDCSGIFHRVVNFVKSKCDSYTYPSTSEARDSRSLAGWYHDQNNLVLVQDPVAQRNLIKPGTVMFFGGTGKRYSNLAIGQLSAPYPNGIVEHIGVVTEVKKNDAGDVVGYVMFHGRRPGTFAQRSHYHAIDPPRLGYPPLGNWNQQWLAAAYIMTPKKES